MTTLREAAQQALTLLELISQATTKQFGVPLEIVDALKAALAEYDKDRVKVEEMKANWALQRKLADETYERDKQQREYEEQRLAALAEPDLFHCPKCGGPADNGHDRSIPPSPYFCTKCMAEPVQDGCDHCNHPMYCAIKCRVCGRVTSEHLTTGSEHLGSEQMAAPIAWYHVPYPNNGAAPMVSLSKQHEPSMYGAVVPLFLGAPHCPNCASLQDQNTELDQKLAEMERKPLNEFDALRLITSTVGLLQSAGPVEGMIGIIRAVERAHGIGVEK